MSEKTTSNINYRWLLGIAVGLLIWTLSTKWAENPSMPTVISVALGLSSLALAFVTIQHAMHSENKQSLLLDKITNSANSIIIASSSIEQNTHFLTKLDEKVTKIELNTSSIFTSKQIDENDQINESKHNDFSFDQVKEYFPAYTATALYLAQQSFKYKKYIVLDDLFDTGYDKGYIIANLSIIATFGFLNFTSKDGIVTIHKIMNVDSEVISKWISEYKNNEAMKKIFETFDEYFLTE